MFLSKSFQKSSVLACLLSTFFISPVAFSADAVKGEKLSQTCMGCHGAVGLRNANPVYHVPMLGGQSAEYLVAALKGYKNKERAHPTMQAQAGSLSDEDMQDIAAYFSSLEGESRSAQTSELATLGKKKINACKSCHGKTGVAKQAIYPTLAGQYADYIEHALKEYRSGKRTNPIMAPMASALTIEDIRAIAAWYSSQSENTVTAPSIQIKK